MLTIQKRPMKPGCAQNARHIGRLQISRVRAELHLPGGKRPLHLIDFHCDLDYQNLVVRAVQRDELSQRVH